MKRNPKSSLVKELKNTTVLITGGAGSVGSALVKKLLEYPIYSVRVLDIDETENFDLEKDLEQKMQAASENENFEEASIINLAGRMCVELAIKLGYVDPENVLNIGECSHAQVVRI